MRPVATLVHSALVTLSDAGLRPTVGVIDMRAKLFECSPFYVVGRQVPLRSSESIGVRGRRTVR